MRRTPYVMFAVLGAGLVTIAAACGESSSDPDENKAAPSSSTSATTKPPIATGSTSPTPTNTSPADAAKPVPDADIDNSAPVRFVAMGDTGKGCPSPTDGQCVVAAAIKKKCDTDGCDFAVLLGDNIYDSGVATVDDVQLQTKFEQPYAALNFPFYVVLGNHDYGSNGAGLEYARGQVEVDYTQKSTKWKMPARVYRHAVSNVEFFAMDTQQQLLGNDAQQKTDMKAWMAASTARWKIGLGHHPYLSNGPHGNAGNYDGLGFLPGIIPAAGKNIKAFFDDTVCGKVDLYMSGHDHSRQWMQDTCNGTELVVSGGGASTTELKGSNPSRFQKDTIGFLYVVVQGKTLTAEFIDGAGTVEFTRTLTK